MHVYKNRRKHDAETLLAVKTCVIASRAPSAFMNCAALREGGYVEMLKGEETTDCIYS